MASRSRSPERGRGRDRDESDAPAAGAGDRSRSRSPRSAPREREERPRDDGGERNPGNNLHVGNLAYSVDKEDLVRCFDRIGDVGSIDIVADPVTGASRGFAFVQMKTTASADEAISKLSGTDIKGRAIRVERAKRARGYDKTPGQYMGPPTASVRYRADRERGGGRDRDRYGDRGGYDRRDDRGYDRRDDRGYDRGYDRRGDDRRGGYDDRRGGGYDDRRGGYDDRYGGGR
mmetsp:Transcript_22128/g.29576  ORF Transcript_22128/g.29576 Transcript_22128/m.29576 type:complete len:232 (-) Transcript_22128:30-725(-)